MACDHVSQDILVPMLTSDEALDNEQLIAATQRAHYCLGLVKPDQRSTFLAELRLKMWVVIDASDGRKMRTLPDPVQLSQAVVHVVGLPPKIRAAWKGPPRHNVSYLYKVGSEPQSLPWEIFWQELGCWPVVSLQPSGNLPLWQSESEDFAHIVRALSHMTLNAQEAAKEMVQWLVPHGTFYAKYFPDPASRSCQAQVSQNSFAYLFCNAEWMPSFRGTQLLSPMKGWILTNNCKRYREYSSNYFLSSHCFEQSVHELARRWTCLNWVWDKPTSKIICETLKAWNGTPGPMSYDHATQLYDALRSALEREHIRPDQGEEDPDAEVCQEVQEVRAFLKNEPWIFLPDISSRERAFESHWEPYEGTFFATSCLAVNDQSSLFLKTSGFVTEEMAKLAADAVGAQALNAYYRYPLPRGIKQLFQDWGVLPTIGWGTYLEVLRLVDSKVGSMDPDHSWEDGNVYSQVVRQIMLVLGEEYLEKEMPGRHMHGDYEEEEAEEDVPGRSREDLKKFISEVKHLRIILTERLHFRKPVEVVYIADVSDWLEEAKDFVAKAAKLSHRMSGKVTKGVENLGLASFGLRGTVQT